MALAPGSTAVTQTERCDVKPVLPEEIGLFLFTGNYGSGKTEVSVNVANALARSGRLPLTVVDMDIVNPYFRSREARRQMQELGVRVLAPEADMHNADLPIVLPEVKGAVRNREMATLLDVGGDNVGATVLASLAEAIRSRPHKMYFVLNRNRPFTGTVEGALQLMDEIEAASRVTINGVVGNTHLMEETTLEMAREGAEFCLEVAEARGVEAGFVTAPAEGLVEVGAISSGEAASGLLELEGFPVPVLPLERIMLPPWLGGATPGAMATHSRDRFSQLTGSNGGGAD
jgi:hypothetical protein